MTAPGFSRDPGGWEGPQHKGALREHREGKRIDADQRDFLTENDDRRSARCPHWCGHKSHARPSRREQLQAVRRG